MGITFLEKLDEAIKNEQTKKLTNKELKAKKYYEPVIKDGKAILGVFDQNDVMVCTCEISLNNAYDDIIDYLKTNHKEKGEYIRQNKGAFHLMSEGESRLTIVTPSKVNIKKIEESETLETPIVLDSQKYKLITKSKSVHIVNGLDGTALCGTRGKLERCSIDETTTCRNCIRLSGETLAEKVDKVDVIKNIEKDDAYYIICNENDDPIKKSNKILKHYIYNNLKKATEGIKYIMKNKPNITPKIIVLEPTNNKGELSIIYHTNGIMYRDNRLIKYYYYYKNDKYGTLTINKLNNDFKGLGAYLKQYTKTNIYTISDIGL